MCARDYVRVHFFVEYLYKNWGDAKLFVSVCVFMYVLSARTIRVVLVVVVLCIMYACVFAGVMRLLLVITIVC